MRFFGVYIEKHEDGFEIHQRAYIERQEELPQDSDFVQFRRARAKLSWLVYNRPDICVVTSKLAQMPAETFEDMHVKQYKSAVRYLQSTRQMALRMRKMDPTTLQIRAYADASFSTNRDHTSQLGYIALLCDKNDNACMLHFASYKSHGVAGSALGAETYAFADVYDFAYCAKVDLESVLEHRVPLTMLPDSKSLFGAITQCSHTQEKRLIIDLQSTRNAYPIYEISHVGFIRGPNNPADELTKIGNCAALEHMFRTGKADFFIDLCIIRNNSSPSNLARCN